MPHLPLRPSKKLAYVILTSWPFSKVQSAIRGRAFFVSIIALGLTCIFTFASVQAYRRYGLKGNTSNTQEPKKAQAITGIAVNLTRFGFEPAEITIPEGNFYLYIANRIGTEEPVYTLFRSNNEKLQEDRVKKGQSGLDKILNLKAGDYTVQETSHPEYSLSIKVVDPKKETR